jgi:hypothetical protein
VACCHADVLAKTFGKFWSTCGRPHVRPCAGGARLCDHALVGPHVGVACGTISLFFFKLFLMITSLFCDASFLLSLVPHG